MKKMPFIFSFIITFLLVMTILYAAISIIQVPWSGGAGAKEYVECPDGFYAIGLANYDWGNNDQSVNKLYCSSLDTYFPDSDTS